MGLDVKLMIEILVLDVRPPLVPPGQHLSFPHLRLPKADQKALDGILETEESLRLTLLMASFTRCRVHTDT